MCACACVYMIVCNARSFYLFASAELPGLPGQWPPYMSTRSSFGTNIRQFFKCDIGIVPNQTADFSENTFFQCFNVMRNLSSERLVGVYLKAYLVQRVFENVFEIYQPMSLGS